MTAVRKKTRAWAGPLLVVVIALLVVRSCRLAGVSRKIYGDELQRHVITADDFALFASTLKRACASAKP
jgi:hypothetical protein